MSDILSIVGSKIRDLRKEKGLTQEELGEIGNFHFSYIGQVERGEKNISLLNLAKIAESLEVEVYELFSYAKEFKELTDKESALKEVLIMLTNKDLSEIKKAHKILKEIFETYS
jgi:transcriptional regulator with XRE-family HTH domain